MKRNGTRKKNSQILITLSVFDAAIRLAANNRGRHARTQANWLLKSNVLDANSDFISNEKPVETTAKRKRWIASNQARHPNAQRQSKYANIDILLWNIITSSRCVLCTVMWIGALFVLCIVHCCDSKEVSADAAAQRKNNGIYLEYEQIEANTGKNQPSGSNRFSSVVISPLAHHYFAYIRIINLFNNLSSLDRINWFRLPVACCALDAIEINDYFIHRSPPAHWPKSHSKYFSLIPN